ncbi:hypothetical protein F5887DRAFT_173424 [Amanita rubescens]|nr:hypothetical protein F5887DRAFT_173424 [Amanita rubescens]
MHLRVIVLPVHLLAMSLAVFRHGHRYRTKQYYWDDLLAASTLTSDVGLFLSVWVWPLHPAPGSEPGTETRAVVRMWVAALLLPCVVWSSRIGVAFSIYRIAKEDVIRNRHGVGVYPLFCV